jgi:hypothetical protein
VFRRSFLFSFSGWRTKSRRSIPSVTYGEGKINVHKSEQVIERPNMEARLYGVTVIFVVGARKTSTPGFS